jgi:two-component system, cell cycle sensor histidine kinase and response regulator CckA
MTKIRILIVEDEALLALSVQRLLNRLGYDAFGIAVSGDEAVGMAKREKPDLIMMDIHLRGEMDGIQVAERIRDFIDAPIVYTTAFSDEQTVERAKKSEPSAFLLKPYDIKDLQVTIEMSYHRHRADRLIRENERRISTLLRCIDESVITVDNSGAVAFMNPNAERLTGRGFGEALGKRVENVLPLNPDESHPVPADAAVEDGGADGRSRGFFILEKKDGTTVPVECSVAPLIEEWGGTAGRVFVLRDVSAERREEEERRRIEAELAQSQKMETVGKFASGITHDFSNYLAVITGSLELQLNENQEKGVPSRNLELALEAVEKANGLIENLLQFSRKKPVRKTVVDVNRAVENLLVLARCVLSTRIQITTELHPENPRIMADPIQFEQILMNLVVNARDAMPSGGRLMIRVASARSDVEGAGKSVEITVSDTGKGMAREESPDGTAPVCSTKPNGAGFGLFIVHEIAKWHGGSVRIESAPGSGAAFHVLLPEFEETKDGPAIRTAAVLWNDAGRENLDVCVN